MKDLLPGAIFALVGLVILDGVSRIASSAADLAQAAIDLKVAQKQVEINKLGVKQGHGSCVQAIGFNLDEDDDEDDDYYDD